MSVIEVSGVCKKYPLDKMRKHRKKGYRILLEGLPEVRYIQALDGVSFNVSKGECLGIVGPNGSGKTTLLSVIAGILKPEFGVVRREGRIVSALENKGVLDNDFTGEENRRFLSVLFGMSDSEILRVGRKVFDFAGLSDFAHSPVVKYSKGMRERLLVSILVHSGADVLLLDETLSESDEGFRRKCLAELKKMSAKGAAILFVSHNLGLVESLCPRALFVSRGKVVEDGSTEKVLKKYRRSMSNGSV